MAPFTIIAEISMMDVLLSMAGNALGRHINRLNSLLVAGRANQSLVLPGERKACFGVVIKGPDFPTSAIVAFGTRRCGAKAAQVMVINMA
jgi:hypothetical protein